MPRKPAKPKKRSRRSRSDPLFERAERVRERMRRTVQMTLAIEETEKDLAQRKSPRASGNS